MNITRLIPFLLAPAMALTAAGATIDDAKRLAEDGDTDAAIALLQQLEQEMPRDAEISKQLGDLCLATGRDTEARKAYDAARRKGSREAVLALAEMANLEYRVDDARQLVEDYRKLLKKGKRTVYPDNSGNIDERIDRTENMLGRVEQIEVIDSLVVDAEDFFRHYRLTPESGSINPVSVLPDGFDAAEPTVVYEPESRRQMIWAVPDTAGTFSLVSSSALYGDAWEKPTPLGDNLGEGGDANYPFLMPDGITLYYANDGENSLGGLDIFISRRSDDGFLQPQNLGMPYNSPYDDYMLAIDELTGAGWWATDRNRIPGKVTIYVFIPQELRRNVSPDSPDLISRARLTSIRDTWNPETDRNAIIERIVAIRNDVRNRPRQFEIAIPGRGVYTNYDDFRTPQAKAAMHKYVENLEKVNSARTRLAQMRQEYAKGNRSDADVIRQAEEQLEAAQNALVTLRNDVITLER